MVSNGKTITHFSALGQTVGTIRAWQIPLAGSGALDSKKTVLPEPYAAFQSRLLLLSFYPFILLVADHLDTVGELEINRQRLKSSMIGKRHANVEICFALTGHTNGDLNDLSLNQQFK